MGTVASFGMEALSKVRTERPALNDIAVGLLFGIDVNGKAIPADKGTNVKAVGIVTLGTPDDYGVAREFNKVDQTNAGKFTKAEGFAIVNEDEGTFTEAQIGNLVYLGDAGAYTLVATSTIGETLQKVGKVYSKASVQIDLGIDPQGEILVASNFDVVEVSVDGVLATSGIALVTTGASVDVAMTLGAPTKGTQVRVKLVVDGTKNLVITTGSGITFDGTHTIATLDTVLDELVMGYKSATEWIIVENIGAVALS